MEEKEGDSKQDTKNSLKSGLKEKPKFRDYGSYAIVTPTKGQSDISLALKIIKKNGEQIAIWYYEINSPIKLESPKKLEFSTPNLKISIQGENLQNLFDALLEHKVVWIKEPESEFKPELKDGGVWVKMVLVEG